MGHVPLLPSWCRSAANKAAEQPAEPAGLAAAQELAAAPEPTAAAAASEEMPFTGTMLEPELLISAQGFPAKNRVPRKLLENSNHPKKVVKRGRNKNKETHFNIFATNAASLKSKMQCFKN